MKKDMINIDDFVREKLVAPKDDHGSAANWLKMKELLDKELPQKSSPLFFRWGKPMAFVAASILIGALMVGGYELIAIKEKNRAQLVANPINTENPRIVNNSASNIALQPIKNADSEQNNSVIPSNDDLTKLSANNSSNPLITQKNPQSSHLAQTDNKTINSRKTEILNNSAVLTTELKNEVNEALDEIENRKSTIENRKSIKENPDQSTVNNLNNGKKNSNADNGLHNLENKSVHLNAKGKSTKNNVDLATSVSSKSENLALKSDSKSNPIKQINNAIDPLNKEQKNSDSITVLSTVTKEKNSKTFPRKKIIEEDTISDSKIAVAFPSAGTKIDPKPFKKDNANESEVLPSNPNEQSKVQAINDEGAKQNLSSNSNAKKKSNILQKIDFSTTVSEIKKSVGNAQVYAGFMGGFNYSISNQNNFQGIQFGPTVECVFNNHWSFFAGLKYFNRSGGNKTINDNYSKETTTDTPYYKNGNNSNYLVNIDSSNRYFKFSTLHSFELPLTVRYSLNKFYIMTGINLAYYLGVNVEEVRKNYTNTRIEVTNLTRPILRENKPTLAISDFGDRIGIGYVFGVGYQISPAWQTDLRVVSNFWDNAKTDGSKRLSKDFYKLPSIQLSVGYQFNRGKTKPKFGPNDTPN
jgi:hypothetical protein